MHQAPRFAFAATILSALVSSALAQNPVGLHMLGPIDPVHHYPNWIQDKGDDALGNQRLALELLTSFPGVIDPPNLAAPASFPDNWSVETFYYMAVNSMASANGNAAAWEAAMEGSFANEIPRDPDQILFSRIRIRITGLTDGEQYTIVHPYGTDVETAEAGGINLTRDIGIAGAGDFSGAIHGDVGPFLVPATMADADLLPGAWLGDGATLTQVRRGLNGQNYLQISGAGIEAAYPEFAGGDGIVGNDTVRFDQFTLLGQIANQLGASIDQSYYSRKPANNSTGGITAVNVWASSASGQNLVCLANMGTVGAPRWSQPVQMAERADSGEYFARVNLGDSLPPSQVRVSNLSDGVPSVATADGVSDLITVESAIYTVGGDLVVRAHSSDFVQPPAALSIATTDKAGTLGTSGNLGGAGSNLYEGGIAMGANSIAPSFIDVQSQLGFHTRVSVEVEGDGSVVTAEPVIANAGADQSVLAGDLVQLAGGNSLGQITAYFWSGPVALSDATIANPFFTAPSAPGGALALDFTLTVTDNLGTVSTDIVRINVSEPSAAPADVVTVDAAQYRRNRAQWRASGTSSVIANQIIDIYLGTAAGPDLTRKIGEAVVDATGVWAYQGGRNSASANIQVNGNGVVDGVQYPLVYAVSRVDNPNNQAGSLAYRNR